MDINSLDEFKEYLIKTRKESNLSVNDLAQKLRVRDSYIDALERADISELPEGYVRIFYRTYFKTLGLNSDEMIKFVDRFILEQKVPKEVKETAQNSFGSLDLQKYKTLLLWIPVIATFFVLIYLVADYFDSEEVIASSPVKEITIEEAKKTIDTISAPEIDEAELIDSLRLRLDIASSTYILVKKDSVTDIKFTAKKGSYSFVALDYFDLYVSKGSVVKVFLNDSLIQGNTSSGMRINFLSIDRSGIKNKSITRIPIKIKPLEIKNATMPITTVSDSL